MRKTYLLAGAFCLVAVPAFAFSFSSIALSPDSGAWGRSHGFSTRGEADATAIGYCQQHANDPDDCRVVTWAKGGYCASVAVHHKGDGSVVWGSASGPTKDIAESKAYDNCVNERGKRCDEILASVCSD
jgi:hypothetical protein